MELTPELGLVLFKLDTVLMYMLTTKLIININELQILRIEDIPQLPSPNYSINSVAFYSPLLL
jgi:hypothetical protein